MYAIKMQMYLGTFSLSAIFLIPIDKSECVAKFPSPRFWDFWLVLVYFRVVEQSANFLVGALVITENWGFS